MDIEALLKQKVLILDGAMGTTLQERGMQIGGLPEAVNIESPQAIIDVHREYINAGAQIITTNTFGANELKLSKAGFTVEEVIYAAIQNAKKAIGNKNVYIALDIGPTGSLIEPLGELSFEDTYTIFKRQVMQGVQSGADLILIETMTDLHETKAAVLAAKENSNLPILCTMSFEKSMRTFMGASIESMVSLLQDLGVEALGANCSLGPKELRPIIDKILEISKLPVMVQPNAGLPTVKEGVTTYNLSAEKFAAYGREFIQKGVQIIGGCCGTSAEHIRALVSSIKD